MKTVVFALVLMLLAVGCSSVNVNRVMYGEQRPAISPGEVVFSPLTPTNLVGVANYVGRANGSSQKIIDLTQRKIREDAASIGANYVVFKDWKVTQPSDFTTVFSIRATAYYRPN